MKIKRFFSAMLISGLALLSCEVFGQEHDEMSKAEHERADSAQTARHEQEVKMEQAQDDEKRLSDAKDVEKETRAKAKEARRIDRQASSAAREAKMAVRQEKKAQKARRDADKQARKADRAKMISDKN